jgi:hypothetical protein
MIDDKVAGFLLLKPVGRLMRTSAIVIAPEYRNRRISTMLFATIEFDYLDSATFTAKRVAEFGMPVSRSLAHFQRSIGASKEV